MANSAFLAGSGGSGAIVQMVSSPIIADSQTNSATFVDIPNAQISITPKSLTNKILVMFTWQQEVPFLSAANAFGYNRILRNALNLTSDTAIQTYSIQAVNGIAIQSGQSFTYADVPTSLSQITYSLQQRIQSAQANSTTCKLLTMTLIEIQG